MRVLFLTTPFDARWHLDGTRRAIADLAPALTKIGVRPIVLTTAARSGLATELNGGPLGSESIAIDRRLPTVAAVAAAVRNAKADVVHAVFAPRAATGLFLRTLAAMGVRVVQTIASMPRRWSRIAMAGDPLVVTSKASARAIERGGVEAIEVPMPFTVPFDVQPIWRRDSLEEPTLRPYRPGIVLYVGDYEHGGALEPTLRAFAAMTVPHGLRPRLLLAGRSKSARAREIERGLRGRADVEVLGEVPDLLPWILAASCVVLPARDTFAKLDHPRALLEAIALGTPIVVGPAPSLAELVADRRLGEVARDETELREAMERGVIAAPTPIEARRAILEPRAPRKIAEIYASIYARRADAPA